MTMCPSLEDLALYAGCDHEPAAMAGIREHLAGCGECRQLVANLQDDRELLGTSPLLPEEAFLAVRDGVVRRLRNRRRWRYASMGATAATIFLAWLLPLSVREDDAPVTVPQVAAVRTPPPVLQSGPPPVKAEIAPRKTPTRPTRVPELDAAQLLATLDELLAVGEPQQPPPAFTGSVVVTLQTQDPDVTIILLEQSTGGAE